MAQLELALEIVVTKEIDGIEMGVLGDGTPYLTGRSVARFCGVHHNAILTQTAAWSGGERSNKFASVLADHGFDAPELFLRTRHEGREVHAYPEHVVMAFLEYYAFDAGRYCTEQAKQNYRLLARRTLREFIYRAVGYDPDSMVPEPWRQFHDRVTLNTAPPGFFSVFREISEMVVSSIRHGLKVDEHTVPDISVGKAWSTYWKDNGLAAKYGERTQHPHLFPDYFPQAASNPVDAYVYPLEALGEFRRWLESHYLPIKFPTYIQGKVKRGSLAPSVAELILAEVATKPLPSSTAPKRLPPRR